MVLCLYAVCLVIVLIVIDGEMLAAKDLVRVSHAIDDLLELKTANITTSKRNIFSNS